MSKTNKKEKLLSFKEKYKKQSINEQKNQKKLKNSLKKFDIQLLESMDENYFEEGNSEEE